MNKTTILPKKYFYLISILCSIIIMALSLEVMFKVKDVQLYEVWIESMGIESTSYADTSNMFSTYVTAQLAVYVLSVITPMMLGLNTYFAYVKLRVNYYYVFIWSLLSVASMGFMLISTSMVTIFTVLSLICYVLLIISILNLVKIIRKGNNFSV